ncbi:hypothetical protein Val02_68230 [Virgisporangium aliadipatigenens]|uniref:Right handed beta helix domain-containing protein n=1 Tax=Virgisporangium aliadipatigenens TaxID=741659 RepID=A0A8J3YSQ9_9ACTN|nr:right-handed parallel beta-helix repeat-containing protein [Virgisporangium aliadipatigenens]GIJ49937.1 hypothetical protein Val02_68230 [Virgisporangium aliadipatigenens]
MTHRRLPTVLRALPVALVAAALPVLPALTGTANAATAYHEYALDRDASSPAAMTVAGCNGTCVLVPKPTGTDDWDNINAKLVAAAKKATASNPVNVLLQKGTYYLSQPLDLPPNVNLKGLGMEQSVLRIKPGTFAAFSYSYMVRPKADPEAGPDTTPGSTNLVSDLTINGNCVAGAGTFSSTAETLLACAEGLPSNAGGGIKVGHRWTVRQVRFTNLNYFKIWVKGATDVRIVDNRWDNRGGAGGGEEDNIGGGGNATRVLIEKNEWDATIRGNSIDLTNAADVTVRGNIVTATPEWANKRKVKGYGTMYMEAVTRARITDNVLTGAGISLKSNVGYDPAGENLDVTNPRDSVVNENTLRRSFGTAITVNYDDHPASAPAHVRRPGGNNAVIDNVITDAAKSGIMIVGLKNADKDTRDVVTGNRITNVGVRANLPAEELKELTQAGDVNRTEFDGFEPSGIALGVGNGDIVHHNTVVDTQGAPTTWYGLSMGQRGNSGTTVTGIRLTDDSGNGWDTVVNAIGGARRTVDGNLPAKPTGLSVTDRTFGWSESNGPVGGYRVYRNGKQVATYTVGGPVPNNLVADFTPGSASSSDPGYYNGWRAFGAGLAGANEDYATGTGSLAVTPLSDTTVVVYGPLVKFGEGNTVAPGQNMTSVASFKALGGSGRSVRAGVGFFTAEVTGLGEFAAPRDATMSTTAGWVTSSYTTQVPASAMYARSFLIIDGATAADAHLIDRVGLVSGTATEGWVDAEWAAGNRYQVVAFRAGDGANSPVATVIDIG